MKKTFRTILAGALALLTVSCYDDSALRTDIADLQKKVAELEQKLNSEISTLNEKFGTMNTAIGALQTDAATFKTQLSELSTLTSRLDQMDGTLDGKITSTKQEIESAIATLKGEYTSLSQLKDELLAQIAAVAVAGVKKDAKGNATITFADGQELYVPARPEAGVVTVKDGKWAVVDEYGNVTVLEADLHPDTELEFRVDPETNKLQYSVNGAAGPFTDTGVNLPDGYSSMITGMEETDSYIVITFGDNDYYFPRLSTNSFEILSGMVFFEEGTTKTVPVKMQGIKSSMLANAPAGWTAKINGNTLEITAPGQAASSGDDLEDDMGGVLGLNTKSSTSEAYDEYGTIEIWVVSEDGKTFVGTLSVSLSNAFADIKVVGDSVKVDVPMKEIFEWNDDFTEELPTGEYELEFKRVFFGACEVDKFDGNSLSDILGMWDYDYDSATYPNINGCHELIDMGGWTNVKFLSTKTVALKDLLGAEPEPGKGYMIWSYCGDSNINYSNNDATFIKKYFTHISVKIAEPVVSWKDAELKVEVTGAEKFHLMVMHKEMFDGYSMEYWSEEALANWQKMNPNFNFYALYMPGMVNMYPGWEYEGSFSGMASAISPYEPFTLNPAEEMVVCVLPLSSSKTEADYSLGDVVTKTFKLNSLVYGGTASVTFANDTTSTLNSISGTINSTGATTLYKLFTTEEYASVAEGIVDYMIDNISELDSFEGESYKFSKSGLSVNTSYTLAAVAIDNAGQIGEVKTAVIATKNYPYSDALSVAIEGTPVFSTENETHVTITYKVTGATKLALYGNGTTNKVDNVTFSSRANDSAAAALNIATNNRYNIVRFDVPENGLVAVTYKNYNPAKYNNYMYSYAVAYNEDESGNVSAMSQVLPVNASEYDTTLAQ